jgi:hypothetical protein
MENTLVVGEYRGVTVDLDRLREQVVPSLIAEFPGVVRGTSFRRLDGDPTFDYWLVLELALSQAAPLVAERLAATADQAQAYHEVFRMTRTKWGIPHHVSLSADLESIPDDFLTVLLPVPEGRSSEWNQWYDGHHMPTVLNIAPAVRIGHRYAPISEPSSGDFLVLYEFESHQSLVDWQAGSTVASKQDEYFKRWRVRNNRRGFSVDFRVTA